MTAGPDSIKVWDAYLDSITYAISAAALLAIVERMPGSVQASHRLVHDRPPPGLRVFQVIRRSTSDADIRC